MFENLRAAFREAVDNFKDEMGRDQVPEAVDRILKGMRDEVTEAKTRLHDLETAIQRALLEADREKKEEATCIRREKMARDIGDEETARVAAEFRVKHAKRREVLEGKAVALKRELEVRQAEIQEMIQQIKEAQKKRDALAAEAGRSTARESIRGADDLFGELDRMAEKMGDEHARERAEEDILDDLGDAVGSDYRIDLDAPTRPEVDVDARLAELKRRMGRE